MAMRGIYFSFCEKEGGCVLFCEEKKPCLPLFFSCAQQLSCGERGKQNPPEKKIDQKNLIFSHFKEINSTINKSGLRASEAEKSGRERYWERNVFGKTNLKTRKIPLSS